MTREGALFGAEQCHPDLLNDSDEVWQLLTQHVQMEINKAGVVGR